MDPIEQIRAQQAYLEAGDLGREADDRIEALKAELARWEQIRATAKDLGAEALQEVIAHDPEV